MNHSLTLTLLLAVPFLFFVSCKKDELEDPIEMSSSLETNKEALLSDLSDNDVINFFNLDFIEATNPNVVPLAGNPPATLTSTIEDVYMDFLIKEGELHYVNDLIPNVGYSLWRRAQSFQSTEGADDLVVIPFVSLDALNTSSIMMVIPDGNDPFYQEHDSERAGYYYITVTRSQMATLLETPDDIDENTYAALIFFINFDENIFDFRNEEWITIWEEYDDGFQSDLIDDRQTCYYDYCADPLALQDPSDIDDRTCNTSVTIVYTCPGSVTGGSDGGTFGGGSTPGSVFGGDGGSSSDGGIGGGGGISGTSAADQELVAIIQECIPLLPSTSEGFGNVVSDEYVVPGEVEEGGETTPSASSSACELLAIAMNNISLTSDQWLYLFNHNHPLLIVAGSISPDIAGNFGAYVDYTQSGLISDMTYREFSKRIDLVTDLIVTLNLSPEETSWLISDVLAVSTIEESVAEEVDIFLSEYSNDELAKSYVKFILNEYSQLGSIDVALLNPFEEYANNLAILENFTTIQQTETQNGIEILGSYLSETPQISYGTPLGGTFANPIGGPDLNFGTEGDINILTQENQVNAVLPVDVQERRLRWLFFLATAFDAAGEVIVNDYLEHFHENESVFDHYNENLSKMVMNSRQMKNWLKVYGDELNEALIETDGEIENVGIPIVSRTPLNETHSLTILINGTQIINMQRLDSYNFNEETGEWDCYFEVNVVDHFGLDDDDVIEFQDNFPGGNGFIAWWALQHLNGWAPFKTDIWFIVKLGGQI